MDAFQELESVEEIVQLLPAGGGIHSKGNLIDAILQQKWPDNDNDNCA